MHTAANPTSFVKMAIFDMDNTLLHRSFIHTAAAELGFSEDLKRIIAECHPDVVRTQLIAQLLKGRTQEELTAVVRSIPIVEDAAAVVASLIGKGYVCGIISDSYTCITNYVKEKLGMHFSCANVLEFDNGRATGVVSIPANFLRAADSGCMNDYCKCNMMHHMRSHYAISLENTLAIGDGVNDICMIRQAGTGIAFNATNEKVNEVADHIVDERSFMPVLGLA
ncbi:HAD-IB family phosphatase [Chitinophaga sp. GCM10012297]|uniref:phosphoserine phosphatase n=1 Tax=Chitinophaga chungangae TaxID=2821488 RepID=A0ABS3YKR3_9BACT|nr:HAD-IB family phosphatase [Chitinophaga chungangae]MBO9155254.1 HAD-IB family phosphatase [Chitinophaga chungangae]